MDTREQVLALIRHQRWFLDILESLLSNTKPLDVVRESLGHSETVSRPLRSLSPVGQAVEDFAANRKRFASRELLEHLKQKGYRVNSTEAVKYYLKKFQRARLIVIHRGNPSIPGSVNEYEWIGTRPNKASGK